MNNLHIEINGRKIGPEHPTYIIAEMSANHNHSFNQAVKILEAAKTAGADAIKLQTYTADTITIDCNNDYFRIQSGTLWDGKTLYDLYQEAYTPWEWQPKLMKIAEELELDLFSSPFDDSAVEFLENIKVPAYKIASFENIDLPLIRKVARTGKPVIISTGMANLGEIAEAVETFKKAGGTQLALLKCTSSYPSPPEDSHLNSIPYMSKLFQVPIGLSDHTHGVAVPVAAKALGACIIEKHFTLSRTVKGPDSEFSLEPHEFKEMVDSVRTIEKALGKVKFGVTANEEKSRVFRRSLFVVKDIKKGELFTEQNIRSIRPGNGLHTRHLEDILGLQASQDIERGTPLSWELLGGK